MRTSKSLAILALAVATQFAAVPAMAVVVEFVDFIAGEGYIDDDLTTNSTWTGDAGNIVSTTAAGYDTALGIVTMAPTNDWIEGVNSNGVSLNVEGDTITVRTRFQYGTTDDSFAANIDIFSIQFYDEAVLTATNSFVRLGMRRFIATEEIGLVAGVSGGAVQVDAGRADEADLGHTLFAASTSDWLELTASLTRGFSSTWTLAATLTNLETTNEVLAATFNVEPQAGLRDDPDVFGGFNSSMEDFNGATTNRIVDTFELSSDFVPPPDLLNTYDFSSTNYTDGVLLNQDGWNAWNGSLGANVISNGVLRLSQTANWRQNWQTRDSIDAARSNFYVSAQFSFTEATPYVGSQQQFMNVQINDNLGGGGFSAAPTRCYISRDGTNTYAIEVFTNTGPPSNRFGYATCSAGLLGLDVDAEVDVDSDTLELRYTLTKGSSYTDWTYLIELYNVDTGVKTISSTGTMNTDTNLYNATFLVGGLSSGQYYAEDGFFTEAITNRVVYNVTIGVPSTACPEPLITSVLLNGANVDVTWDSQSGCSYQMITNVTMQSTWGDYGSPIVGDGTAKTGSVAVSGNELYIGVGTE